MNKFFKKLFTFKDKIKSESYNKTLVDELYKLYNDSNLEELILDPVNKLYIINVYYTSIFELIDSILVTNKNIYEITSINLYSYFKPLYTNNTGLTIQEAIKRLIQLLEKNPINKKTENDVLELITAYNNLKEVNSN